MPGHREPEVARCTGPGHERPDLGTELQPELHLDLLRALRDASQLGQQPLDRRLDSTHRLFEVLLRLVHHPPVRVPPAAPHSVPADVVLDPDEPAAALLQRELHEPLAHTRPRTTWTPDLPSTDRTEPG